MNILITGSSSGIGLGLTKYYLENKHNVIGVSRRYNDELKNCDNYKHIALDLADFDAQKTILNEQLQANENFDLVILNAGILSPIKDMGDVEINVFKDVMDVNVWSNKVLLDILFSKNVEIKQIVAISSGASVFGNRGWNAYSISKAALNMLVKLYAKEREDIHFSAIAPGLVDTHMQDYISALNSDKRFPSVDRLKAAKGTASMPTPEGAAPMLVSAFSKALGFESGSYIDVREL